MELKQAQQLIFDAVENPVVTVPPGELALAVATVLLRNELLGATPRTVKLTYLAQEDV